MAAPRIRSAQEEASRWVVRHSGQGMDAQAQAEFEAWYRADASHADAYERLARLWRRMGEIERGKLAPRRARKRGAAAALALLAAWPAWQLLRTAHPGADYTSGADVRRVALPDGSSATLDADSAIAIDFAPGKREVRLLAGRALFTVAPRAPGGPDFTVVTPDASATALGTRYSVAREVDGSRVVVYEHRVAVQCLTCQDGQSLALDAGQGAAVSATGILRLAAAQEPAPDWSQGLLAFNDVALPEAAARLSRYGGKHILVLGEAARSLRVSGTASIGDPKRALALLLAQAKVGITELPGLLIVR
ncbi:FecR family protein 15 [Achromobacter xylosoxidans A8]|uniref:FecR family protein 15 n=1 Tax=Achromobacter xylosoxidans (strain A8) TaxID=762376 RepID=E3HTV1_ACHXA|nr:FecR domain-containing protein [Achromobacter xylosoxidans]ADP17391.1 FecR family protein 15 [Achromobacter xylosoxidans A8]